MGNKGIRNMSENTWLDQHPNDGLHKVKLSNMLTYLLWEDSVLKSGLVRSFVFFWGNWTATETDGNRLHVVAWSVATGFYEDQLHTYKSQELVHKSRTLSLCISIMSLICMKQQVFQPPLWIFGTHWESSFCAYQLLPWFAWNNRFSNHL